MASHLTSALRCRFRHTAICVFEKNYRLQDIQLSKSLGNQLRFQTYRPAQSIREPTSNSCPPSPFVLRRDSLRNLEAGLPAVARFAWPRLANQAARERRLVENTGLEPATSWLQTRRSPS